MLTYKNDGFLSFVTKGRVMATLDLNSCHFCNDDDDNYNASLSFGFVHLVIWGHFSNVID